MNCSELFKYINFYEIKTYFEQTFSTLHAVKKYIITLFSLLILCSHLPQSIHFFALPKQNLTIVYTKIWQNNKCFDHFFNEELIFVCSDLDTGIKTYEFSRGLIYNIQ